MANPAKLKTPPAQQETSLAQQFLDMADGRADDAVDALAREVLTQGRLRDALLPEMARIWAQQQIHTLLADNRRAIIATVKAGTANSFGAALRLAATNEHLRLMAMPIWGGKPIAEATAGELRESARRYGLIAADTARKARWQGLVADAAETKGEGTVEQLLDEATLAQLWEQSNA